jgi:hypothetical protein
VRPKRQQDDPIRAAALKALSQMADPLLELMFDAGMTVQEFNYLLRGRAVRAATKRVLKECGRNSKSRIAIMTGLPRSEVGKISDSYDFPLHAPIEQHSARRVLAAWYDNPQFVAETGEPAVLPIFGKRRSFERLVSLYGGGIPVRAMLDELTQIAAVELLADQTVRAKSRVPILTGLTPNAIAAIGERCGDLLRTLTNNVHSRIPPLFEATALVCDADVDMIPMVRRELAAQGTSFINDANSLLNRSRNNRIGALKKPESKRRLGVTVYYFENEVESNHGLAEEIKQGRRKNLRRQKYRRKIGGTHK